MGVSAPGDGGGHFAYEEARVADTKYVVVVGLNYPTESGDEKRAEPGDIVTDIQKGHLTPLVEQGIVRPLGDTKPADAKAAAIADFEALTAANVSVPIDIPPPPPPEELPPEEDEEGAEEAAEDGGEGPTKAELYERAQSLDIPGRSTMSAEELAAAIAEAEAPEGEGEEE